MNKHADNSLSFHLKLKETIMQTYDGASLVDVTACGWVNPPKARLSHTVSEVTCEVCLERIALESRKTPTR